MAKNKGIEMKLKLLLIFSVILAVSVNNHSYAQSVNKTIQKLNQKVEELEKKVEQLELRINKLENKLMTEKTTQKSPNVSKGDYKDKGNWRKLEIGMTKYQVKELLGEPERISKDNIGSYMEFWSYGLGRVTFGDRGTLISYSEP